MKKLKMVTQNCMNVKKLAYLMIAHYSLALGGQERRHCYAVGHRLKKKMILLMYYRLYSGYWSLLSLNEDELLNLSWIQLNEKD